MIRIKNIFGTHACPCLDTSGVAFAPPDETITNYSKQK